MSQNCFVVRCKECNATISATSRCGLGHPNGEYCETRRAICPACGIKNFTKSADQTNAAARESTLAIRETRTAVQETTAAVRETTTAVRETTAAVQENTATLERGFGETVSELRAQRAIATVSVALLASIDSTVRSSLGLLSGIREDLYATTKNREALEAKSKLERADHLLASDLPADALLLIREAEKLNPADFCVWYAKASICQLAVRATPPFMPITEAQSEGLAALERAVKLFPVNFLSRSGATRLTAALACSSVSFGDRQLLIRSVEYSRKSLELSGPTPETIQGVATLYKALESIQDGSAEDLIGISFAQLASVLRTHGESALQGIASSWHVLEQVRPGGGSELAATVSEFIENWIASVQQASKAAFSGIDSWPSKAQASSRIDALSSSIANSVSVLQSTVSNFGTMGENYPALRSSLLKAQHVSNAFSPARWGREIAPKKERWRPFASRAFWFSYALLIMMLSCAIFVTAYSPEPQRDGSACGISTLAILLWPILCGVGAMVRNSNVPHEERTSATLEQVIRDMST